MNNPPDNPASKNEDHEFFNHLIASLNLRWKLFRDLFQSEEGIGIFSRSGQGAWEVLQECTLDAIFMDISRLMDPKKTGNRKNLSLEYILQGIPRSDFSACLDGQFEDAQKIYDELIKPWRNQRLGHNNLDTVRNNEPLPDVPYRRIDDLVNDQ